MNIYILVTRYRNIMSNIHGNVHRIIPHKNILMIIPGTVKYILNFLNRENYISFSLIWFYITCWDNPLKNKRTLKCIITKNKVE